MSHSPDLASWRWMNWLRCSSADSGNSKSRAFSPVDALSLLNSVTDAFCPPDVSLPVQYVTVPVAPFESATVGALATPEVAPVLFWPALVPVPLPPELVLLSSPPQAATKRAADAMSAAAKPFRPNMCVVPSCDPLRRGSNVPGCLAADEAKCGRAIPAANGT